MVTDALKLKQSIWFGVNPIRDWRIDFDCRVSELVRYFPVRSRSLCIARLLLSWRPLRRYQLPTPSGGQALGTLGLGHFERLVRAFDRFFVDDDL